jgi:hypothetical protein
MGNRNGSVAVSRDQVLAYRAAAQDLEEARADPLDCAVLDTGVRDSPPGRTAAAALCVRSAPRQVGPAAVTVDAVRGEPHVHRAADLGLLRAALRWDDVADLDGLDQLDGVDLGSAVDAVAEAMRAVCADGTPRQKDELRAAVTALLDDRFTPWCVTCRTRHVHNGVFGYATLPAGLRIDPRIGKKTPRFWYVPLETDPGPVPDPTAARRELVRRYLHLVGPAGHTDLAGWLGILPAAARRLLDDLDDELVPVTVADWSGVVHAADLDALVDAPPPRQVRLLPSYDPLLDLAVRELTVPDVAIRPDVWPGGRRPGVLLVRGEVAGRLSGRVCRDSTTLFVTPFRPLADADRVAITAQAALVAELLGVAESTVRYEDDPFGVTRSGAK